MQKKKLKNQKFEKIEMTIFHFPQFEHESFW